MVRGQAGNRRAWPGGWGRGGALAPWRTRAMSSAVSTTSRTRIRPPHLRPMQHQTPVQEEAPLLRPLDLQADPVEIWRVNTLRIHLDKDVLGFFAASFISPKT